ncbi:MAG: hypothetical protein WKF58_20330 [Ilumatobacteraceae bacterium]
MVAQRRGSPLARGAGALDPHVAHRLRTDDGDAHGHHRGDGDRRDQRRARVRGRLRHRVRGGRWLRADGDLRRRGAPGAGDTVRHRRAPRRRFRRADHDRRRPQVHAHLGRERPLPGAVRRAQHGRPRWCGSSTRPTGEDLHVTYDGRIEPALQSGRSGSVAVLDGTEVVAEVEFHTRVWP